MNKRNQITEGVIWKQLLLFFFPIVFGTFFQQIYNTADTIVVGRFVGKEALAAVGGSVNQVVNLIVEVFVGLTSGAAVIVSQFYGAKDKKNLDKTIHTAFAFSASGNCDRNNRISGFRLDSYGNEYASGAYGRIQSISPYIFFWNAF